MYLTITRDFLKENKIECLAACIYFEARGESQEAQRWVAHVALNRVTHAKFPDTLYEVIFQKSQFSWTRNKQKFVVSELAVWDAIKNLAKSCIAEADPTANSLYFIEQSCKVSWTKKLKLQKHIDHLLFFSEK